MFPSKLPHFNQSLPAKWSKLCNASGIKRELKGYTSVCTIVLKRMGRLVVVTNASFYERFTRVNSMRAKAMQCGDVCSDWFFDSHRSTRQSALRGGIAKWQSVRLWNQRFQVRFPVGLFFLLLFLIFNDKCSWQVVKKFAYASFANLLLPIIHGLLLGMTWPVYKQ